MEKCLEDKRSKRFIFIPFCVLCQAFQAKGIVKGEWTSTIEPIISLIMKYDDISKYLWEVQSFNIVKL